MINIILKQLIKDRKQKSKEQLDFEIIWLEDKKSVEFIWSAKDIGTEQTKTL